MGGYGKLLCILFKLPRRIQYPLDDPANPGAEILDELIELRLAAIYRKLFSTDAFGLQLAALQAVVLEKADGPGDGADFVVAIGVLNFDVRPSLGEDGEGFRYRLQWLGDAADGQHCHSEHKQSG